jgi:DNA transposition AAA+ family ATPase
MSLPQHKPIQQISFAPLRNVTLLMQLYNRLRDRGPQLPGFGVFYGDSGYGKTRAAIYLQNKTRGLRIEIGESWNRKTFVQAILRETGVNAPRGTISDLMGEAIMRLAETPDRPLIIDEADKLIHKGLVELARELFEGSQVPVILLGEELLPKKLEPFERVHNRILEWTPAEPCNLDDVRHLARLTAAGLQIPDDLLERIRVESRGVARRVDVNLARLAEWAKGKGVSAITAAAYDGGFYTGVAPSRRSGSSMRAA